MTQSPPLAHYLDTPPDQWRALTLKGAWDFPIAVDPGPGKPTPKRTENRLWSTSWRGPVLIHTGLGWDPHSLCDPTMRGFWRAIMGPDVRLSRDLWHRWARHVVAVATIVDCHRSRPNCCKPWGFHGPGNHHLTLDDVRPLVDLAELARGNGQLPVELRTRGMQQLWKPDPDVIERICPYIPPSGA